MRPSTIIAAVQATIEALTPESKSDAADAWVRGDALEEGAVFERAFFVDLLAVRTGARTMRPVQNMLLDLAIRIVYGRGNESVSRMADDADQILRSLLGLKHWQSQPDVCKVDVDSSGAIFRGESQELQIRLTIDYDWRG